MRCWADVVARPKVGDVVRMRCGRVTYRVVGAPVTPLDPFVDLQREAPGQDPQTCSARVPNVWADLVNYGAVSVEPAP